MKKRKIIAMAAALMFTFQAGFASNISGVSGVNGVYNINPEQVSGANGFRHYENFYLSEKDIANLVMKYGTKDISTFINMVDNQVNIQGILNTVRNGEFANGHAIFVSPNGMVVGASGVLNVGSLSVLTPTTDKYNSLLKDGAQMDVSSISNEGHADILIRGKVLSRGSVNIQGANVALPETSVIANGVTGNTLVTSQEDAQNILFNSLVNTGDLKIADALTNQSGKVVISSHAGEGMLNVRGIVTNANSGNIQLSNEGAGGLKVTGEIANANGNLELMNTSGKTLVKGSLENDGGFILISDKGDGIHLNSGSSVTANTGSIKIKNEGTNGLSVYGDVTGLDGDVSLENTKGNLYIAGNVNYDGTGNFQIVNNATKNSQLMIAKNAKVNSTSDAYIKNTANGGLFVNGTVNADNSLVLDNSNGDLTVNNSLKAGNGLSLQNTGNKLAISSKGSVINDEGNLVIKNTGANGALIYGTVKNNGEAISITNTAGNLLVNGNINAKSGNLGIINDGDVLYVKDNGNIEVSEGKANIINRGKNGLYLLGKVASEGDDLLIQNENGKLYIDGDVNYDGTGNFQIVNNATKNSQLMISKNAKVNSTNDAYIKNTADGGLFVNGTVNADNSLVLDNSNGDLTVNNALAAGNGLSLQNTGNKLAISSKGSVINDEGNLVIKNTGANGAFIYGTVENDGDTISITNTAGDLLVNGNINAKSGNLGIINDGNVLYVKNDASINVEEGKTNIVNNGKNGLYMLGKFSSTGDDVLLQNENGKLYIDGNVSYDGAGKLQIINNAEKNSQLMISKNAKVNSTNDAYIKNTANGGLFVNGTVNADNSLVLDNSNGDLTVNNSLKAGNGLSLQNTGNKLAISSKGSVINDEGNLVIKNSGVDGTVIYGTVENDGETISITNTAGNLNVNGKITAKSGNLGIVNKGNQLYLKDKSVITNADGKTNIINTGNGGLKAVGKISVNDGELNIYNDAGQGYIDGTIKSNGGDINILSRYDSKGMYIRKNAKITNIPQIETDITGNIVIKDTANAGNGGLIIKGTVTSGNDVLVRSAHNNTYTSGTVNANNNITYSQSAKDGKMTFNKDAQTNAQGTVTYTVTNGSVINDMRKQTSDNAVYKTVVEEDDTDKDILSDNTVFSL